MSKRATLSQIILFILPVIFILWAGFLKVYDPSLARKLTYENGSLEWIQFWCYLIAGIIATWSTKRLFSFGKHLIATLFAIFSAFLFFVALEEISWGQWVLSLDLPEYFTERNTQKNLTLHNLDYVQPYLHSAYIAVGLLGALAAFLKGFICRLSISDFFNWVLPEWWQSLYFLPIALFYIFTDWISPKLVELGYSGAKVTLDYKESYITFHDQELIEVTLAFGFLFFAMNSLKKTYSINNLNTAA